MKVLHVAETIQGGVATVLRQLSESKTHSELEFYLLSPRQHSQEIKNCAFNKFYYFNRTGRNFLSLMRFAYCFSKTLLLIKPDIVHLHSSFAGLIGRIILLLSRPVISPKIIYMPHGWSFMMNCSKAKLFLYSTLERLLLPVTDKVICVSHYERNIALEMGLPDDIFVVIHNGVSCDPRPNSSYTNSPYRDKIFNILFVGRLDHQKGHDVALKAMTKLPKQDYHLTIVGESVISASAKKNDCNLSYVGWLDSKSLVPYFKNADVLLMPSRWEAFGLVAIEAQSHSLPVLASNCCALPEVVIDGVTGFLFDVDNVDAISELILSTDKSKWHELGANARQNYLDNFTSEKMCTSICSLYFGHA